MAENKIPSPSSVVDKQFVEIKGADGLTAGFQYNKETNTFYAKESQILIPSFHGSTHISSDPIPCATTDSDGLLCSDDKTKLDNLVQMRLGVLGFTGSGYPDDNGYMQGDILLAAGSEFISLERVGNVIRFNVESPIPFTCGVEECANIFWVQDETDTSSIRPPSCAGKLPGTNSYGEMKIYLMPENTIVNPSNPSAVLNKKGNYPSLIFKRYDDGLTTGTAEFDMVLSRNSNKTAAVGWAMTPGALGKAECVWSMGLDDEGDQIRFNLELNKEPGILGALLYNGHSITKQAGVIVGYSSTVINSNQYLVKIWDVLNAEAKGESFTATNVWKYTNAEYEFTDVNNPKELALDGTVDVLPIGTLISLWEFKIGEVNGTRLTKYFFIKEPHLNPKSVWTLSNKIQFGDVNTGRDELNPSADDGSDRDAYVSNIDDLRLIEKKMWGIVGFDDPLYLADDGTNTEDTVVLRSEAVASIDIGTLLIPPSLDVDDPGVEPTPNFIIVAKYASLGGPFRWLTNEYAGKMIKWTSGVIRGTEQKIIENTASTLTVFGDAATQLSLTQIEENDTFDIFTPGNTGEPSGSRINNQYIADIDSTLPGLKVVETLPNSDRERPIYIWDRHNHNNFYTKIKLGQPVSSRFPPIDILLRSPIDSTSDKYIKVLRRGQLSSGPFAGNYFITIVGATWNELPKAGTLRILNGYYRNYTWKYDFKAAFDSYKENSVMLINASNKHFPFDDDHVPTIEGTGAVAGGTGTEAERVANITVPSATTVAEVLHEEYTSMALRLEFSTDETPGQEVTQLQFRFGFLDMSTEYEYDIGSDPSDELVRGFKSGHIISKIHTQNGISITGAETVTSDPENFIVYKGGFTGSDNEELFNDLEIMVRDSQVWVWWNKQLITPDSIASSLLPTPVAISTAYFTVSDMPTNGKFGLRLWPGSIVRSIEVRDQALGFSEFTYGQLDLISGS